MSNGKNTHKVKHNLKLRYWRRYLASHNRWIHSNSGAGIREMLLDNDLDGQLVFSADRIEASTCIDNIFPRFSDRSITRRNDYSGE